MLNSGFRGKRATDGTGAISAQTQSVQATNPVPKITGYAVTDNSYVALDDTAATSGSIIVIYGNNFVSGITVYINNSLVSATYLDSTRITFTMPALSNGTYIIYMTTPQGGAAILSPGIIYSGFPTWTTSNYNASVTTINIQLVVSGDAPLTYSLQGGSTLPTGITLTSTGLLTGTASSVTTDSVFYFTVIVDDAQLQSTQQSITLTFQFTDPYWKYTSLLLNAETNVTPFINDASTNSFALTIAGDTKPVLFNPYQAGYYSNYFDGTGDYLAILTNAAFNIGTNSFTVEAWINTSSATQQSIFNISDTDSLGYGAVRVQVLSNQTVQWLMGPGGSWGVAVTAGSITLGTWNHIAITRNGSSVYFFINGSQVGSTQTYGTSLTTGGTTYIGYNSGTSFGFNGYISNLRFINGNALYTSAFTPSTTPLTAIANTSLLTCQSNRFIDNSTNNFTITKAGDVSVSPNIPFTQNSSYATYGSTYFDGTGDFLSTPATGAFYSGTFFGTGKTFTVEAWLYQTTFQTASGYFNIVLGDASGASGSNMNWCVGTDILNKPIIAWYDGASKQVIGSTVLTLNTWNHVAWVVTAGVTTIYVNGVIESLTGTTTLTNPNASTGIVIGVDRQRYYTGFISNLRAISGTAVYTTTFTPPTAPLTAIANTSLLTLQYNGGATNQGIIDNSNFNNIITRNGNTSQGTFSPYSVTGWSNYFDGTGDYLTIAQSTPFLFSGGNFTIECYIYPTTTGTERGIVNNWQGGGAFHFTIGTGNVLQFIYTGAASGIQTNTFNGTTTIPINVWTHVAVVRVGNTLRFYINGVADSTTFNMTSFPIIYFYNGAAKDLKIGVGSDTSNFFNGYISNLRILKGTGLYTANFTPSSTPLTEIANTVLLTCQSNRLIDNSVNNFTLNRFGDASVQVTSPFGSVPEAVPISYSNYFDGTGDYLSIPDNTVLDLATGGGATAPFTGAPSFTIECWFYCTALTATEQDILNKDGTASSSYTQYSFTITSAGLLKLVLGHGENASTGNGTQQNFTILNSITLNTWYHVAACQATPNQIYTFLNGTLIATTTRTQYMANGSGKPLLIGYHTGQANTQHFNGFISNVRIIKGTALYTTSFTPSTTPLTAITNTSLLTCQSTSMIDNSTNNFAITANGNTVPRIFNPFGYTNQNNTSYTPSTHGGSAYFDGTGDYLTTASSPVFANLWLGNVTVECWVYFNSVSSTPHIWSFSESTSIRVTLYVASSVFKLYTIVSTGSDIITSATTLTTGRWYHIAITRASTTWTMWLNGISQGTSTSTTRPSGVNEMVAIGTQNYSPAAGDYLNGYVSDIRVTNGIAIYTSNFVPPAQAVANYSTTYPSSLLLNFNNGGIVDRDSSNILETVGNAQLSTAVKKYGSASMYFDGTGDYLTIPTNLGFVFGTGDFTIEAWFYIVSGAVGAIFDTRSGATGITPLLFFSTSQLRYYVNGVDLILSPTTLSTATWYHVALVRSSGSSKMYLNGAQTGSTAVDANNFTLTNTINIGRGNDNANVFNGYIDDLRITKGFARYTANFSPSSSALLGQ